VPESRRDEEEFLPFRLWLVVGNSARTQADRRE
jgi:hypothetical protein